MSLNALAVSMHLVYSKQEEMLAENPSVKKMSIYTLTEDALLARNDIKNGVREISSYPAYVKEILFYEKQSINILKTRMNFLAVMALGLLSPLKEKGLFGMLPTGYFAVTQSFWSLKFNQLSLVELSEVNRFLSGAATTRELLVKLGEATKFDDDVANILKFMDKSSYNVTSETSSERKKLMESIFQQLIRFRDNPS